MGFTLPEVAIALTLMTVVLGSALSVMFYTERFLEQQLKQYGVEQTGRLVIARLSGDLRAAEPTTIAPALLEDSSAIHFQKVVGYSEEGGTILSAPISISFELAPGEVANGQDDNGDGRPDEGSIVYAETGAPSYAIAGNVLGLRFAPREGGVTLEVELGLVDRQGRLLRRTFSQSLSFRN